MDIRIIPRSLSGSVTPPPSKSMAHRLLLAAALSQGTSILHNVVRSKDVEATLRCMEALGASWQERSPGVFCINGCGGKVTGSSLPHFDCGESGSTLRFLIPLSLAVTGGGVFTGHGRLMERPLTPYFDLFDEKGIRYTKEKETLTVEGQLTPGTYRLAGNLSSQFFTGLLFALPLLESESTLSSTTALESAAYLTMTTEAMHLAGIPVHTRENRFTIPSAAYHPFETTVEADWSQAAFWFAALALGSPVDIQGLNPVSNQGDRVIVSHYLRLSQPGDVEIDLSGCPDLLPPLAVMAARRQGITRFTHAARLRLKESDRLASVYHLLTTLGAQALEGTDSLTVFGLPDLRGGVVDGANDHRIVMAAAIAAIACQEPVTIVGAEAVSKSYPDFFSIYRSLGGDYYVL